MESAIDEERAGVEDLQSLTYCNADAGRFDSMKQRNFLHFFRVCSRDQDTRRSFVEEKELGADLPIHFDARTDAAEGTFREGNGQAAIGQIMGGLGEAFADDFADGRLDALFVIHVERRRQTPKLFQHLFCILRAAELREVWTA